MSTIVRYRIVCLHFVNIKYLHRSRVLHFYRPQTKLWEGNDFTLCVILFTGGSLSGEVSVPGVSVRETFFLFSLNFVLLLNYDKFKQKLTQLTLFHYFLLCGYVNCSPSEFLDFVFEVLLASALNFKARGDPLLHTTESSGSPLVRRLLTT